MVIVILVMLMRSPEANDTVLKLMSAPEVPTVPSNNVVGVLVVIRNTAAVPVASAELSSVMALAVAVPVDALPNAGSLNVSVASF